LVPFAADKKEAGTTTCSAYTGDGVVVVRNVKATICTQCGEEWIDNTTAQQLEAIVSDARERRLQVEVTAL
jgi:YgiT-type zinc finger domain-containing protein